MGEISFSSKQEEALLLVLDHTYTLFFGGSRSGKTFAIIFLIVARALKRKSRHAILRYRLSHLEQSIMHDTFPKVCELMGVNPRVNHQKYFAEFSNGSTIWFGGLDDKDRVDKILGNEYNTIFLNEASQISFSSYATVLSRLSQKVLKTHKDGSPILNDDGTFQEVENRMIIDENPPSKLHWTYKLFFEHLMPESAERELIKHPEKYGVLQMNPIDNLEYIDKHYIEKLEGMPKAQRQRFLHGNFADAIKGALFTEANIIKNRVTEYPELKKIVVAIDPATTAKITSDPTGIMVCGIGFDGRGYLLEDSTGIYTPRQWSKEVVRLYKIWNADIVVGESNQGGDMVLYTIQTADENIPVKLIHATKGKVLRAEPISAIYEKNRISHVGAFPDAEEEMCNYSGTPGEKSPNRLDALVYGFTELFPVGVLSDSDIFNRDSLSYYNDYDFEDSTDFTYIKITNSRTREANYNFLALFIKIKDKKIFVMDCILNENLPADNIEQINNKLTGLNSRKVFLECNISFASFMQDLKSINTTARGIKEFNREENRIISEANFIKETFVFEKNSESIYYKNFMQRLQSYTVSASEDESVSANILASISYVVKRLYKSLLK